MRSGNWRGAAVAIAAVAAMTLGSAREAKADGLLRHTIPRETLALDYRTGDVMMAPPIPYGEYTKDYAGAVHGAAGMAFGAIHGVAGHIKGLCAKCGGGLCGQCGGKGLLHGGACGGCGGDGCGTCGSGLLGHGGNGLFHNGMGGLFGRKHGHGHDGGMSLGGHGLGLHDGPGAACVGPGCASYASSQAAPAVPAKASGQAGALASSQQAIGACGGCLGTGKIGGGGGCGLCGGTGLIKSLFGKFCGGCHGAGCGGCGGTGLLGHGGGDGSGHGHGGDACGNCHGRGCGLCSGLKAKAHGLLGVPAGLAAKLLHKGEIQYFVGPGGPVPLTPGYVPYVVPTRSPRDFFAFPPFSDQVP